MVCFFLLTLLKIPVSDIVSDVYISLNGDIIKNHGLVVVNSIGFNYSTSLLCHYDGHLDANCELDWFKPNGSRITTDSAEQSTTSNMVVSLTRTTAIAMKGIYHCALCNGNASRKVYVGIYPVDEGNFPQLNHNKCKLHLFHCRSNPDIWKCCFRSRFKPQ